MPIEIKKRETEKSSCYKPVATPSVMTVKGDRAPGNSIVYNSKSFASNDFKFSDNISYKL